jgi:tetratricopeptide (TPR) repeat protein
MADLGVDPKFIEIAHQDLIANGHLVGSWAHLAGALRRQKHYHACEAVYELALAHFTDSSPGAFRLWGNLGILYREWERYDEAIEAIEHALRLKPGYVHALESKAMTFERMHMFREAASLYSDVLQRDPQRPQSWNNFGLCLFFIGQQSDAIKCLRNANAVDPSFAASCFNIAAIEFQSRNFDLALSAIEQVLQLNPHDSDAEQLKRKILSRPVIPETVLPVPIHKNPLVVRLSTNIDANGRTVEADLTSSQLTMSSREYGTMSRDQTARIVGFRAWDVSHLEMLLKEQLAISKLSDSERNNSLFLSYRWESELLIQWVARLAGDLAGRGYRVVYDKKASGEALETSVPDLISKIASCATFVPILTEGYRRRVEIHPGETATVIEDGWAFDEWRCALHLCGLGHMKMLGVWRSGPTVPMPLRKKTVADFRNDEDYLAVLNQSFPKI